MAKKISTPVCDRCETPFRSASSFCPGCGGPTAWASHDERVEWEVRQWRASRASKGERRTQMMLVRTEAGYEPVPMLDATPYAWEKPLHPERVEAPPPVPRELKTEIKPLVRWRAPVQEPAPAAEREEPANAATANGVADPVAPTNGAHTTAAPTNGSTASVAEDHRPVELASADDGGSAAFPMLEEVEPVASVAPVRAPQPPAPEVHPEVPWQKDDDRVTVSKKAVAVAIALVLGLPFGGKLIGLASSDSPPKAPVTRVVGGVAARPAALVTARSGFEQLSPDAVRYAVVITNPNKSFLASGVTVKVSVHDSKGRLIGADTERLTSIPAAGATGVAGALGVSGSAARMSVTVGTSEFHRSPPDVAFRVQKVRFGPEGGRFLVRAAVSGLEAVRGARVVVVYLDRAGKVVGGDFTYVDVPRAPRSVTAVISTAGITTAVARVEVYVLRG